jgi:amino acid permease
MSPSLPEARGTTFSTGITLISNTVGAGLLSLPFCIATAGLAPGALALLLTGVLNCASAVLIARCCQLSGAASYMELVGAAFGRAAQARVALLLALYTLGSCASYVVVLGDQLPSLLALVGAPRGALTSQALLLPAAGLLVLFPLSLLRDLSSLRFTSSASFLCIAYVSLLVVGKALRGPLADPRYLVPAAPGPGVFVGLPIALVSFTCHYNIPRFYGEFGGGGGGGKLRAFCAILAACFVLVTLCYESVAVSGYLLFGSAVAGNPAPVSPKGDILVDFGAGDAAVVAARFALVVTQVLNFPIVFNSHRASVIALLPARWQARLLPRAAAALPGGSAGEAEEAAASAPLLEGGGSDGAPAPAPAPASLAAWAAAEAPHWALTALLVAATVTFAVAVPNLSVILGVKGALGATLIVYALPAAIYFVLSRRAAAGGGGGLALLAGGGAADEGSGAGAQSSGSAGGAGERSRSLARDLLATPPGWLCIGFCAWAGVVMVLGMVKTLAPAALA